MARHMGMVAAALLLGSAGWTATYTVSNSGDSGTHSLRWAIAQANTHAGPDTIVFAPGMSGATIQPLTQLPVLTDPGATINGDINGDGAPDVRLDGGLLHGAESGLKVLADSCTVIGLAITHFPVHGIYCQGAAHVAIRSCHAGVNLPGTVAMPNLEGDLYLNVCTESTVGGTAPSQRNIVAGGVVDTGTCGIFVTDSKNNTVVGNYVGLRRDGSAVLGTGGVGITVAKDKTECTDNTIGPGNVLGGLTYGVRLVGCKSNTVIGNTIGLCADGDTLATITSRCIDLFWGAANNTIGGTTPAARNVLAGGAGYGINFWDASTAGNVVQGNYLGVNAAGTHQRRLIYGIRVGGGAGAQTIGGDTTAAGNTITPTMAAGAPFSFGVYLAGGGDGSLIEHNRIGLLPDGSLASQINAAVYLSAVSATVTDNQIAKSGVGVQVYESSANPRVFRNVFRRCGNCVRLNNNAHCQLGNLGNLSHTDDGGNVFGPTNTWAIRNETPTAVKAEGNDFGTTSAAAIEARIWDKLDDPALGRVDYIPLQGGIIPTGGAGLLALTAATAQTTKSGAEIAFSLSAPASVTVSILNLAGRLIATPARETAAAAGVNRVLWSGQTASGTMAPGGAYLVRIQAQTGDGQQAQSLCRLNLMR